MPHYELKPCGRCGNRTTARIAFARHLLKCMLLNWVPQCGRCSMCKKPSRCEITRPPSTSCTRHHLLFSSLLCLPKTSILMLSSVQAGALTNQDLGVRISTGLPFEGCRVVSKAKNVVHTVRNAPISLENSSNCERHGWKKNCLKRFANIIPTL